jgi:hypothetical protein
MSLVAHAKVLSGNKLEQLVVRLQRHSGRPKQECWRFVIQHGLKTGVDHRRWTEEEIEYVREALVKLTIEEIAKKLKRTPSAVRSMLVRNRLGVREIRCDRFSLESLLTLYECERMKFGSGSIRDGSRPRSQPRASDAPASSCRKHCQQCTKTIYLKSSNAAHEAKASVKPISSIATPRNIPLENNCSTSEGINESAPRSQRSRNLITTSTRRVTMNQMHRISV